ncbi:MAG: 30S ribosomal protein S11 [Gammaproteobacteria bacterium]
MATEQVEKTEEQSGTDTTADAGGAKGRSAGLKGKRKTKRLVTDIIVHIYASFNNTLATITDVKGNTLSWATAGGCGFRGSRKSTPFAGQVATGKALQKARELYGIETAEVRVYGPGPGRDASVRAVRDFVHVTAIYDVTGIPFNGCRAPKERRV